MSDQNKSKTSLSFKEEAAKYSIQGQDPKALRVGKRLGVTAKTVNEGHAVGRGYVFGDRFHTIERAIANTLEHQLTDLFTAEQTKKELKITLETAGAFLGKQSEREDSSEMEYGSPTALMMLVEEAQNYLKRADG